MGHIGQAGITVLQCRTDRRRCQNGKHLADFQKRRKARRRKIETQKRASPKQASYQIEGHGEYPFLYRISFCGNHFPQAKTNYQESTQTARG